jgi:phosphinothricin acetyltransferase
MHAIRDAAPGDAAVIAKLYAHYVLNDICTFEEVPPGPDEIAARVQKTLKAGLPYLLATAPDGALIGYAYAGAFHARAAYRFTVENSVYVAHGFHRQGIGAALMQRLIADCARLDYRQMVAVISDSPASVALHRNLGFQPAGQLTSVGFKFGRWIDVTYMQLALRP